MRVPSIIVAAIALLSVAIPGIARQTSRVFEAPLPIPPLLRSQKTVYLEGEITDSSAFYTIMHMRVTEDIPGDRVIVIDSPGGDVSGGTRIIQAIDREKRDGTPVICIVEHDASSMAFNILTHCSVRLATAKSHMVVHAVAFVEMPPNRRLTSRCLRELAGVLDTLDEPFRVANARAMHLRLEDYDHYAADETEWSAERLYAISYLNGIIPD